MPRRPRFDAPGVWFHVMNRGIARRTVFENEADVRYFLSRVAKSVIRGEIEIHAFCIMATHFHLLVRSPTGRLSEAMRRIQNEYVRYFNRTRRRDGPLFRGRFLSKPVFSIVYRRVLLRYIDENPVKAGLVKQAWEYPHGSAVRFCSQKPPRWLETGWVVASVAGRAPAAHYRVSWGRGCTPAETSLVELRLRAKGVPEDDLDDLVSASPRRVRAWMLRKALLADHTGVGIVTVPPDVVVEVGRGLRERGRIWTYMTRTNQRRTAWNIALAGLLRHLAGQPYRQIADRLNVSSTMVTRLVRKHAELCKTAPYARRVGRVAMLCLRSAFPDASGKVRNRP